ncbi:MAG: M23 family metallopeptidase [Acinetobacter sp.]
MLRFISALFLSFGMLWIAACTSSPKKPASTPLPSAQVQKLKSMQLKSSLPIPVQNIKTKQLRDTWGASRSSGRTHEGIDIMAPRGTKVLSTTEGLIADLRNNNLGGKVVWIMGPGGTWHYYAHLDEHKRGLNVGDYVKKGDLIGYVGNTGNARHTAPHLHYGIYLDGKGRGVVNPYAYLR